MSDTSSNKFCGYGTNAERLAFTPSPATIAAAPHQAYYWYETDTDKVYFYTTAWKGPVSATGGISALTGDVTATGPGSVAATIANDAVTTAKILNANVTLAKIANASANSKLLGSGSAGSGAAYSEITLGTNLTMTGTTLDAAGGGGGGLVLLEQHTASASASLDFTTFYSSTYDDYEIRFTSVQMGTSSANLQMSVSSDGGSSWNSSANYYSSFTGIRNDATGVAFNAGGATAAVIAMSMQNDTKWGLRGSLQLIGMGSTSLAVSARGTIDYIHSTNYIWGGSLFASFDNSTTAYNALRFAPSSGTFTGTIRIYGLAK